MTAAAARTARNSALLTAATAECTSSYATLSPSSTHAPHKQRRSHQRHDPLVQHRMGRRSAPRPRLQRLATRLEPTRTPTTHTHTHTHTHTPSLSLARGTRLPLMVVLPLPPPPRARSEHCAMACGHADVGGMALGAIGRGHTSRERRRRARQKQRWCCRTSPSRTRPHSESVWRREAGAPSPISQPADRRCREARQCWRRRQLHARLPLRSGQRCARSARAPPGGGAVMPPRPPRGP
jgi:hypothetical protein